MGVTTSSTVAATWEFIESKSVSSNTASLTFGSGGTIPQTYTDLILIMGNVNNTDASQTLIQFNSDTGSNYSRTALSGNGSSAQSHRLTNDTSIMLERDGYPSFNGNKDYTGIWNIMNYANTTTYKTVIGRGSSSQTGVVASVGLWRSTSAITSFKIQPAYGYLFTYGTFNLYGVKGA